MKNLLKVAALVALTIPAAKANINARIVTLTNPTYGDSGILFDDDNSPSNICRAMGYESGISGSVRYTNRTGDYAVVNNAGEITAVNRTSYFTSRVTCTGFTGHIPEVPVAVSKPLYPGSNHFYDDDSSAHGICKNLGYERGYGIRYTNTTGDYVSVNSEGEIENILRTSYYVGKVFCVSEDGYTSYPTAKQSSPSSHSSRLGFNFRERAYQVADTVYDVAKAIEPFLNNREEQEIDALKKQAQRLKSRIKGGRRLSVVRNTLFHLEEMLAGSEDFMDLYLESDRLDSLAGRLMTARESILGMVDYLDNDFNGVQSELY